MPDSQDFDMSVQKMTPLKLEVSSLAPIDKAATEMSNCLGDLQQSLNDLFAKISPVLQPDHEVSDPGEDVNREGMSVLQKYFLDETDHINHMASIVRSVTNRVEC